MKVVISTLLPLDRKILLLALIGLGYKWHGETSDIAEIDRDYPYSAWSTIRVDTTTKQICGVKDKPDYQWPEQSEEVLGSLDNSHVIYNVGDYTAVVGPKGIQIGCQFVTFDKFEEIAKAVAKIKQTIVKPVEAKVVRKAK